MKHRFGSFFRAPDYVKKLISVSAGNCASAVYLKMDRRNAQFREKWNGGEWAGDEGVRVGGGVES